MWVRKQAAVKSLRKQHEAFRRPSQGPEAFGRQKDSLNFSAIIYYLLNHDLSLTWV